MKWVKKKRGWKLLHLLTAVVLALSLVLPCGVGISEYILAPSSVVAAVKSSTDLAEEKWIKDITISTKQNISGQEKWVKVDSDSSLENGANVRVKIAYTIPHDSLAANGKVTYQFPDGFKIDKEQTGHVYDSNDSSKIIGEYTISTTGKVEISFNENFDPAANQIGTLQVNGILENDSSSSNKTINFPGAGTAITVKKPEETETKDISVKKTGQVSSDQKKVDYTVVVSTQNGSPGKVDVTDQLAWINNATGKYNEGSFKIVKEDASGQKTGMSLSDYKPQIDNNTFTIKDLPQLGKGESYKITYSVDITPKDNTDGYVQVGNSVKATSGKKESWGGDQKTVSKSMINKSGSSSNGEIEWTITVNDDRRDISHYQLSDDLPNKLTLDGDITITDNDDSSQSASVLNKVIVKGKKGDSQIQLDFSKLPDSLKKHSFKIVYKTKTAALATNTKVTNKADFKGDGHSYNSSGEATVATCDLKKQYDSEEKLNADEQRYKWHSDMTLTGEKLSTLTYEDDIYNASSYTSHDEAAVDRGNSSHYALASELYRELTDKSQQSLSGDSSNYVLGKDYKLELTCYDKDGKVVANTDSKTPVKKFKLQLTAVSGKTLTPTKYTIHYSTRAKVSEAVAGETWTYYNKGTLVSVNDKKQNKESYDQHSFSVKNHISKLASLTGNAGSYQSKAITADMDQTGGKIYYKLLLSVDKGSSGKLVATDYLPQGLTYVEGSLKAAFYSNDWYSWTKQGNYDLDKEQKPQIAAEPQADGRTKLTITLPAGYESSNDQTIQLTYEASFKDDSTWKDMRKTSKTYVNTASFKGDEDSQKTTIKRDVPVLAKTGSQVKDSSGHLTNEVAYQVNINPAAEDLNPDGDTVILTDQLSMPSGMQAYLKLKRTKLYQYDPTAKDHRGKELDSNLYSLNYDTDKQELKLELPDKQACVLVYYYSFDSGDNIDPTVSNNASLAGHYSSNTSSKLTNSDSSASIAAKKVTIYKVDADNNAKTLPGAEFSLEKLSGGSWSKVSANLTTDKDGKIVIADLDNNAVYRIKETHAPEGYSLNKNYYYLAWMDGKKSQSDIYSALSSAVKNEIGDQKKIHFFASAGGSIYVTDSYCQLKVSKTWLNHDGTKGEAGVPEITVHLYKATKKLNGVKVKVTVLDGWGNTKFNYDWAVAKGTTVGLSWEKQGAIDGSGLASAMVNGIDQNLHGSKAFTSSALNEDTNIVIKANSWIGSPEIDKADPQLAIDQTSKTLVDTVKLSSANNWQHVWNNLPQEDKDGNSLVYFAEEEVVPGYSSSYRNNNGIKNGEITILNQAKSENFSLPQSGGRGLYALLVLGTEIVASGLAFRWKKFN